MTPDQAFRMGWSAAINAAAQIAIKWRDENRLAAARARKGRDQGGMAEMLDGAAMECNAIAGAIRELPFPSPAAVMSTSPGDHQNHVGPAFSASSGTDTVGAEGSKS